MHRVSIAATALLLPIAAGAGEFNREVRSVLSEHCFRCHGPDSKARKADLRLDLPGGDLTELVARITSTAPDEVMPPPEANKPLAAAQVAMLKRWVDEGARYQKHWAFEPLPRTGDLQTPPAVANRRSLMAIDAFVEATLRENGLDFAPEADRALLVRRAALDLTGLPPATELLGLPYEQVVDCLLASKHFGEHLAAGWLDAARYADTNGYFGDKPRQMWRWRDWVIDAFNRNMPFDQFTIEQLAGDLLPNATQSQRIATAFNRNHMANNESGSIDEEYRTEYVVDRVTTTMTTWLGLTAGCAQCHDHKYDPISQREFYQLFAFFNNVPEQGVIRADNPPPLLEVPSPAQQKALSDAAMAVKASSASFEPLHKALLPYLLTWEGTAPQTLPSPPAAVLFHENFDSTLKPPHIAKGTTPIYEPGLRGQAVKFDATQHIESALAGFDPDQAWTIGLWVKAEGSLSCPLSLIQPEGDRRGLEIIWQKGRIQVNLVHRWGASAIEISTVEALSGKAWHHIAVSYDGLRKAAGLRVYFDAEPATLEVRRDTLDGSIANREPLRLGRRDAGLGYYGLLDEVRFVQSALDASQVGDWFWGERLRAILETPAAKRSAAEKDTLLDYYVQHFADAGAQSARQRVKQAIAAEKALRDSMPTVLVMQEMDKPRVTHLLERGQYDKPGEVVTPDVPSAIAPWPDGAPRNRLGFAQWLVSPDNPLTARVAANRLWQLCFGEGLVRTPNDFGSQGEAPTHPELLDYLARQFRDSGWNTKALLREIVLCRTYRQSSVMRHAGDPQNRLLARGPSGRLSAEVLRDQALALSGLLVPTIGGPSVKPFQPPGLWEAVSYNGEETYVPDAGAGLWRRSLYTYVKRQSPPPMLLTFDGPTREKCTVRRATTNTPLQALLLLNDETFTRAAEAFAKRSEGKLDRIAWMFRTATCREPTADELQLLRGLFERHHSLPLVAHTILNLDEVMTRR